MKYALIFYVISFGGIFGSDASTTPKIIGYYSNQQTCKKIAKSMTGDITTRDPKRSVQIWRVLGRQIAYCIPVGEEIKK